MNMCINSDYFRIETGKILFKIFWFVETTSGTLHEETIETHREITDAIASHDPLRAQDAMYLHLVYNRKRMQLSKTPRGILPVNSNFYSIKEKKYGAQIWISM